MSTIYIGEIPVGDGCPTVFVAELGTFYNKDVARAKEFIDLAVEGGCDMLKTEILHNSNIINERAGLMHTFEHAGGEVTENYRELIERKTVSLADYQIIFDYAKTKNLPIIASVYDFEGVDFLVKNNAGAIKLWKNNHNNLPLIEYAAKTGLPIIFDIVNLYEEEIGAAVKFALDKGASGIVLNYHPGHNPTPAIGHDLRLIETYKLKFGVPAGLSCHYRGDEIMYAAIGAGVNLIEKGVHINPDEVDQNVVSTAAFNELKSITEKVRFCSDAMGSGNIQVKEPRKNTLEYGIVAKKELKTGDVLSIENVQFSFPALGVTAKDWSKVEGKHLNSDRNLGDEIDFIHVD
ncbi:MAG: sialic acid synthase SpsE [Parvicellaceae bacterium]|jgi:sialic acid synthase SpsE